METVANNNISKSKILSQKINTRILKNLLSKKFKKIEYKNTDLNPGYKELEDEYKLVKDDIKILKNCLRALKTYEYGNPAAQYLYMGLSWLERKINADIVKHKGLYTNISIAGNKISKYTHDEIKKDLGITMNNAYKSIAKSKNAFNIEVRQLIEEINKIEFQSTEINKKRKEIENIRFELENAISGENYDSEFIKKNRKNLSIMCKECMIKMNEFIKNRKICEIILKFQKLHCRLYRNIADELDIFV